MSRHIVTAMACVVLVAPAGPLVMAQSGRDTPRVEPVAGQAMTAEPRAMATEFASTGMTGAVATYLHHPALAQVLLPHLRYVWGESALPARHRALLALRAAWLSRSEYLWAHRASAARDEGLTEEELRRVARGPDAAGWDEFEATLLRAADELHVDSFVSDATWQALATRYDTNQLIDMVDTVGAVTMHAGALNSLGVRLEANVGDRLPSGVPYAVAAERTGARLLGREPRIPPVPSPDGRGGANVFRTFVRNPPADRVRGAINGYVNGRATLAPRHRELLLMRIGILCRSEYEFAAHHRVGRRVGMTEADVSRIIAGPGSGGKPIEDALLRATGELYDDDRVSADTWNVLAAELDTGQLLDMLIAVGDYRSTSMLINSAGVQLDGNMADFRFPAALR